MTRIFVNGLSSLLGGGQTYLIHLLKEIPAGTEIHLALPSELSAKIPPHPDVKRVPAEFARRSVFHRLIWETFVLPGYLRRNDIDVYYQPAGTLPRRSVSPCRTAIAFRNMLPFAEAERRRFGWGMKRLRYWVLRFLQLGDFRRADLVVFISHFAKRVIDGELPARAGLSSVIYHGLDESFRRPAARPAELNGEYVLYVSILNHYKAQIEVVRAWDQMRRKRAAREKLVLAGPENKTYARKLREEIARLGLQDSVIVKSKIPYESLPGWYQHAKINIFASSCENCPNILLEKLAAGRPVLSSNYEPMPEVAGVAALYFDPYNPDDLCRILLDVIDDPAKLAKMGEEAKRHSLRYSWQRSREETWRALCALAGKDEGTAIAANIAGPQDRRSSSL
jgi:glycosyltransferase involved in cell wall biosynthesis